MSASRVRGFALLTIAIALVAACNGAGLGLNGSPVAGGAGGPTAGPPGKECETIPTFNPMASPQPTFANDPTLQAEFPQKVNGQAVVNAQTVSMVAFVCYLAGQDSVDQLRDAFTVLGWNVATMSVGSFDTTIDADDVTINAVRAPGQDATKMISNFGLFADIAGISVSGSGLTPSTVSGKSVQVTEADSDGTRSYFYVHGDTLFVIQDASDAQAQGILQALP
jgi:hypothetical protein